MIKFEIRSRERFLYSLTFKQVFNRTSSINVFTGSIVGGTAAA